MLIALKISSQYLCPALTWHLPWILSVIGINGNTYETYKNNEDFTTEYEYKMRIILINIKHLYYDLLQAYVVD